MHRILHTLIFLLVSSPLIFAQSKAAAIQKLMQAANVPGLSLVYVKNGQVNETYHLGVRSYDTSLPVTSATVFAAASLSKPLFAYGVLKLVETGQLDLDKPLFNYFPYPDLEHDDRYQKITARMVLSHTAGLPNWRRGGQLNFQYDPATRYRYSGEGFVFLMKTIEKITGKSMEDWLQETVIQPLQLKRTSYIWKEDLASNFAIPHNEIGKTFSKTKPEKGNSAYSLQTTAEDFGQFLTHLLQQKELSKKTCQAMFTAQPHSQIEKDVDHLHWGLGFGIQKNKMGKAFWQWGDNGTFKAFFIGFPDQKEGLVYFTNSSTGLAIAPELLTLFFEEEQPSLDWLDYAGIKNPRIMLLRRLLSMSFEDAVAPYRQEGTTHLDTSRLQEWHINWLGYQMLENHDQKAAAELFKMNIAAFPESPNVHDSYAEACMRMGMHEPAAQYYLKAYKLNPNNKSSKAIADRLLKKESPIEEGKKRIAFQLSSYANARHVALAGTFNDWNRLTIPMYWEDGAWKTTVDLAPGAYKYKFIVDGVWIPDPQNQEVDIKDHFGSILKIE